MRKLQDYIFLFVKGVCMGGANVLHGISGGTIAFMSGIYEPWIDALSQFDLEAFLLLKKFDFHELWKKINGPFLLTVGAGIVAGLFLLTILLFQVLLNYSIPLLSFFFGLIVIAAPLVLRKIKTWNVATALSLVAGIALSYGLTLLSGWSSPDYFWLIIIAGVCCSCSFVWPGVSGAYILLLLGKYSIVVGAIHNAHIVTVLLFALGFIPGLIYNARISRSLFVHYHHTSVALLAGLMLGALNKLWPWREVSEFMTSRRGEQIPAFDRSILPWDFMTITGKDPLIFQAILMMALGVFIVVLTEKIGARLKTKI